MTDLLHAMPWWGYLLVFVALLALNRRAGVDRTRGRVVGIVGRMGSGKSYFAVRMAYRRMRAGATIYTNFSMRLEPRHAKPCRERCIRKGRCKCARRCPCQMASRWHRFEGWEQFATITDAVVIVDEVDLYAPSHDPRAIPDYVRWKLKMARKHRIDLYWIAQHESRVARLLRDVLTNEIRVCQSWFGGLYFSAKTWDPSNVRRRRKHTGRGGYWFRKHIANLYDTLETIRGDEERGDGTMAVANALAGAVEATRSTPAAVIGQCSFAGGRGDGSGRRCRRKTYGPDAEEAGGLCPAHGGHDPAAARSAALAAAQAKAKAVAKAKAAAREEVRGGTNRDGVRQRSSAEAGLPDSGRSDAEEAPAPVG